MIVVDASAVLELLLRTSAADAVQALLFDGTHSLHAPHLLDLEVTHALRRHVLKGNVSASRGWQALDDLLDLPVLRHRHDILLERIWQLRNSLTAYDAAYVALAEALPATLVTRDAGLAASKGHSVTILCL